MRLIDADKLIEGLNKKYDGYMHEESESPIEFQWMIEDAHTAQAIPIPDSATNGDVIRAIFPNASFHYHKASDIVDDYVSVCINDCDTQQDYSMAWWNSPYQKGGKERDYDTEYRNHSEMILNAQKARNKE